MNKKKRFSYAITSFNSFGFHFKWKFMPVEGAQEIGSKTTGNQRKRKGCLGAGDRLTYVTENQQRKIMGSKQGLVTRVNQPLSFLVVQYSGTAQTGIQIQSLGS